MSNRRRLRVKVAADGQKRPLTLPRYPNKAPALSTVRGWLRKLDGAGLAERKGVERTGKPGRPPVLWGLTEKGKAEAAGSPPPPEPPNRDDARKLLHQACREELGISGRQFVRRLDAGCYECGYRCRCATPHHPGLLGLLRAAQWSRMSVVNASRQDA